MELFIPLAAFLLDIVVGTPSRLPHPVRLIGKLLEAEEALARKVGVLPLSMWGGLLAFGNAAVAFIVILLLTRIPYVGLAVALYLSYAGLALGQLLREGRRVAALIDAGDMPAARQALSGLVTRDTADLDAEAARRVLAETMSENLCDGFIAPFFYLVLGGPALLWLYKAVSTMDSMWGYRTEAYRDFGRVAARMDDVLAFVPARLTAFVMVGAGKLMKLDIERAWDGAVADSAKTDSPNAGWPMAAAAWLIGAPVGGPAVYFGERKEKPVLGPQEGCWDREATGRLLSLVANSGYLAAAALAAYHLLVGLAI